MRFKVVILSKKAENLRSCIRALNQCEPKLGPEEIIVVDDGARGGYPEAPVTWVDGIQPFVYARNANVGIRAAAPSDVILLGDDVVLLTHRGFQRLRRMSENNFRFGLCSAVIRGHVGNLNQLPAGRVGTANLDFLRVQEESKKANGAHEAAKRMLLVRQRRRASMETFLTGLEAQLKADNQSTDPETVVTKTREAITILARDEENAQQAVESSAGEKEAAQERVAFTQKALDRVLAESANGSSMRTEEERLAFVCVYLPRAVLEAVGPLDERFIGYGGEDADYCGRILEKDFLLGIFDGCLVEHGSIASTYRSRPDVRHLAAINQRLYSEKAIMKEKSHATMKKRLINAVFRGMSGGATKYGSDMAAHMPTLYVLARTWSDKGVVELGVNTAFSTVALLAGVSEAGSRLVSYDTTPCELNLWKNLGLTEPDPSLKWDFRQMHSLKAVAQWDDESISLWFLDTSHLLEQTRQELEAWLPKISPQGVMCGHDYFLHEHPQWTGKSGVKTAVDEFTARHADRFTLQVLPHDHGLWILWPKENGTH